MKCPVCDTQVADNAKFCGVCGTVLENKAPANVSFQQNAKPASNAYGDVSFQQKPKAGPAAPVNANVQQNAKPSPVAFNGVTFISADEHEISRLSNSAVTNLMSGEGFKVEGAVLTNKRMYYNHKSGIINVRTQEEIVDVKDITGTKIANFNPLAFLIFAVLAIIICIIGAISEGEGVMILAGILAAAVLVGIYLITKKSHLRIEYAGGAIYFSVKKYGKENVLRFQKQIHAAKEALEAKNN